MSIPDSRLRLPRRISANKLAVYLLAIAVVVVGMAVLVSRDGAGPKPTVPSPVTFSTRFPPAEIELTKQQSAGFIRLVQTPGQKTDGHWLEMQAPIGLFRTGDREFHLHVCGFLVDPQNRERPTRWDSPAISAVYAALDPAPSEQNGAASERFASALSEFEKQP